MPSSIFSVDVEDWFHILDIPGAPAISEWGSLPSRVERNFTRLLDIFSQYDAHVTCFVLGWVGERFPHLVKEAAARGHEIASHGYGHTLVYQQDREEFRQDVRRARLLLEDITSVPVIGYRAPGFSTTEATPWFFDVLAEAGYRYDSSVFPAARGHGGMREGRREPHRVGNGDGILELPITVADMMGKTMCFFGGGYLRLFPYWLVRAKAHEVLAEGRPVVFYIHPREVDPAHPRLPMSRIRRFKSYVNLEGTESKVRRILQDFPVTTFENAISNCPELVKSHVA
ncbi:MAG TPA: XrtA system polysaccharide deacetylase [Candidatus Binatia bacterium]|nr:XrtA system polysaccharide deacetylase [Candidatus Binatia bacterium]